MRHNSEERTRLDRGPYCQTVFYINKATGRLEAFFSSSRRYFAPAGIARGMPAAKAEARVHQRAFGGCQYGFELGGRHSSNLLQVSVLGAWAVSKRNREQLIGGHISAFALESTRHPVGLLFC